MNNRRGATPVPNQNRRLQRRPVIHVLPDEMALRVVCHASVIGGIIGANGCVVSNLRRETGSKIHCESPVNGSDHWVVFIVGSTAVNKSLLLTDGVGEHEDWVTCEVSAAQTALIRVLERSWAVLAAKGDDEAAYCGILADRNQIGAVLGLGGKNVEWMRRNSGAMIRVLPPLTCGTSTDELIQITGDVLAVKKALIMVSTSLQNCPPLHGYPPPLCSTATDGNSEDPHSEFFPNLPSSSLPNASQTAASTTHLPTIFDQRNLVFKLICTSVAVGGIIGKQGTIIRALQNETGASISVGPPFKVSGERLVTISAPESQYSHAQRALLRVYSRSVESHVEKGLLPGLHNGAVVKAKLVLPSQFANGLIGNREAILATGADVNIPVADQVLDSISENELVIEIKGEFTNVQKALSHVASKLRENLLPKEVLEEMRTRTSNQYETRGRSYMHHQQPSHQNHGGSTKKPNASRGDSSSVSDGELDLKMVRSGAELMQSIDYLRHTDTNEVKGFAPPPSLQESDLTQGMKQLQLSSHGDVSSLPPRSKGVALRKVTLELAVEKDVLATLYGRDGTGLDNLQQISGARADIQDPTGVETTVLISGTSEETRSAMTLISSILATETI